MAMESTMGKSRRREQGNLFDFPELHVVVFHGAAHLFDRVQVGRLFLGAGLSTRGLKGGQ